MYIKQFFIVFVFLGCCAINAQTEKNVKIENDSLTYKPLTLNESLELLVEKKKGFNKTLKSGYEILLYNGEESRAIKITREFRKIFPDTKVFLKYNSPDWKVITQSYSKKINAEREYLRIIKEFPEAKIL